MEDVDRIHKYSMSTRTWTGFDVKLPHEMHDFAALLASDERYGIVLNAWDNYVDGKIYFWILI